MNRLWVRLSLTSVAIIFVVGILPSLLYLLADDKELISGTREYLVEDVDIVEPLGLSEAELDTLATQLAQTFRKDSADTLQEFTMAAIVLGLIVWVVVIRTLSGPLEKLVEATTAVASRDLDYRVSIKGTRELVALAESFNQMTASLSRSENLRQNMMADVAHELLTPLTVLEGNLRAILDDVYEMNKEEMGYLYEQTHHLIRLVKDLRQLAQAEAGQLQFNRQPVDVGALVEEVSATFALAAGEEQIFIQYHLPPNLPTIDADLSRLRQVLHNLLANAIRHTPQGGEISIHAMQARDELWLSVEDTGEGIEANLLPQIFGRFYRTDDEAQRWDSGGSGLGLAIVKAIVTAHNGRVDAKSPGKDQGSTVTVYLPLSDSSPDE